uniref:Uncharacterized protein n=1 Tax=Steinernema glaseri TaxID=37863 RepID=A0A1I8AM21_9BILA
MYAPEARGPLEARVHLKVQNPPGEKRRLPSRLRSRTYRRTAKGHDSKLYSSLPWAVRCWLFHRACLASSLGSIFCLPHFAFRSGVVFTAESTPVLRGAAL